MKQSVAKWLQRLMVGAAFIYVVGYVVWQVGLMVVEPGQWWVFDVSRVFAVWFYLPLVILLPLVLVMRRKWAAPALIVPLFGFVFTFGYLWLPKPMRAVAANDAPVLRVLSWNTWHVQNQSEEGAFADAVRELEPDVIALQEVSGRLVSRVDELPVEYPYRSRSVSGRASLLILSKWPITEEIADLDWLGCQCLQVVIDWRGEPVRVVNVHMWAPNYEMLMWEPIPIVTGFESEHQNVTVDALLEIVAKTEEPLVMMGDFNTADQQPNHARLVDSGLLDAQRIADRGLGLTYPAPFTSVEILPFPVIRIDYIFSNAAFVPVRFDTVNIQGSDHLSVVADLVPR